MRRVYGIVMLMVMAVSGTAAMAQVTDSVCTPKVLPWAVSFEENEVGLDCWTVMHATSVTPQISLFAEASTGERALMMSARGAGESCLLATPRMAYRADSLLVSFQLTLNGAEGMLQAGLVSDTADTSTFVPLLTIDLTTAALGYYEFYTTAACGTSQKWVAFRLVNGVVNMDDVSVVVAGNCRRPCLPSLTYVGITTATMGWSSSGGTSTTYLVRCIDTLGGDTIYVTSYATSCTVSGLAAGTAYEAAVATLCGGDTTLWLPIGTFTTDVSCRSPREYEVASLTGSSAALAWTHDTQGINPPTSMLVDIYDLTAAGAHHGATMNVAGDYSFVEGLTAGHSYQAVLQAVCTADTASPVVLTFMPLNDACAEHSGMGFSSNLPLNAQAAYSYAQMLYPKTMLGGIDTLFAVAVRVMSSSAFAPRHIDLYVGQTVDSVLTTNISTIMATKVADDFVIDNNASGWVTIPFSTPVHVDALRNMVVTVVDCTAFPSGTIYFGSHQEPYGGSLYGSSPTVPFDPTMFGMPLIGNAAVADLRLYGDCTVSACQPPAVVVTGVTASTLGLAWSGTAGGTVHYRVCGSQQWLSAATTAQTLNLAGLNAATRYELQVGVPCGSDTVYSMPVEAMTDCGTVQVPYLADFSAGAHPCWQGQQRVQNGGVMADGNMVSPAVSAQAGTLQVRMSLHGGAMDEYVYVGVGDADGYNVTWMDTVLVDFAEYAERTAYLEGYSGTESHLVIAGSGGAIVQWLSIEPLDDCLPPRNITVVSVNDIGATLRWRGSSGSTYSVFLREADGDLWAEWQTEAVQLTLSGLEPNTDYVGYAVSSCQGGTEGSLPAWFSFSTGCSMIRYLPFVEGFEESEALQCWTMYYADEECAEENPMTVVNTTSHSGRRSFRFGSYNYVQSGIYNQYLVSPRIVATDSFTVAFYYTKTNYASEPFMFGISSGGNGLQDFIWYPRVEPVAGSWERYEITLPAAVRYVAIQYAGQENYYLFVDDFTIEGAGCPPPTITAVDEQADHVTVTWQAEGGSAMVAITEGMWVDDVEGTAVTGNSHTFAGLQSGHFYTVGVRSVCPDDHLSDWTVRSVSTIDTACAAPVDLAVDSVSYTVAVVSWSPAVVGTPCQMSLMSDGELVWQSQMLNGSAYMLEGLEPNNDYSVLVRSYCSDVPGLWSDTLHFHTGECLPVGEVSYLRVNYRTVTLSWEEAPVSMGRCRIEYGPEGFERGTGRVLIASTNPVTIDNLEPEPNYDFYLQNYCEQNVLSDTAVYLNIPSGLGIDLVGERSPVVAVYPNPASSDVTVSVDRPAMVSVVDVSGREIVPPTHVNDTFTIRHSSLKPGTCFIRVVNDYGSTVHKLVVR